MRQLRHPGRLIPLLFGGAIAIGTFLLSLPVATADGSFAGLVTALFTATSAVAVTGLVVVDTGSFWSPFGQVVIMLLFQIGGFGIMTAATLLGLMVGRGFGLKDRMATQVERDRLALGDARQVLWLVLRVTAIAEFALAACLFWRFSGVHGFAPGEAAWHAMFHAISAFNNAGFSTFADSVIGFNSDAFVLVPIALAVIVSALGFPVMQDLRFNGLNFRRWTLHSKITVSGTLALLAVGFFATLAKEWANPDTFGPMAPGTKVLNAFFHSVMPRTAGFNSIDMGKLENETIMLNYVLMFIGGGSAGTAGGIKVTTFVVLLAIVWSEIRRQRDAVLFGRRTGHAVERQALSIAVMASALIMLVSMFILALTDLPIRDVLFETISAFATVGLSTGITAQLPAPALVALCLLMFVGRVGTITVATALALGGTQRKPYRYPEETPIVG